MLKSRFIVADFLFPTPCQKFDYAILNPPYVMVEPDARFETSLAEDLYAFFLEKVIKSSTGFYFHYTAGALRMGKNLSH